MNKYNKLKLKIHLQKGLEMETNTSPMMRGAIALSIVIIALGLFALCVTPLAKVFVELIK